MVNEPVNNMTIGLKAFWGRDSQGKGLYFESSTQHPQMVILSTFSMAWLKQCASVESPNRLDNVKFEGHL